MTSVIQRSFSGGEITPALYGRADQAKYATGARTVRNFVVQRYGGVTNRAGTTFIRQTIGATSGKATRLMPFIYSADDAYLLEWGDDYLRFIKDGEAVTTDDFPISAWSNAENYTIGDIVSKGGSNWYAIADSNNKDPESEASYWYELPADGTFQIPSPYADTLLSSLQWAQSADVMTITSGATLVYELRRYSAWKWALIPVTFQPGIDRPYALACTAGGAGTNSYRYTVTSVKARTFEESLAGIDTPNVITGITQANPAEVTTFGNHGYTTGDQVYMVYAGGMTELDGRFFTITVTGVDTFTLDDEDSTGHTAYVSGGLVEREYIRIDSAAEPTSAAPHVIEWTGVDDAIEYNIYKFANGIFGYIGSSRTLSFDDINYLPSITDTLPIREDIFSTSGNYPKALAYYQQRLCFGRTQLEPERFDASRVGNYHDFSYSIPLQADDAVSFSLAGRSVQEIRHIIEAGDLLVFTGSGEWLIRGGTNGALTPTEINAKQIGYHGASSVRPIIVGNNALFVQARGSIVRDLRYDITMDGYNGRDLTIFAAHLFDGREIVAWAFTEIPHSTVWAVRDDGTMVCLTYVREHEVWGWSRHDTDGLVLDAASVPEGSEDALYLVVERDIGGTPTRYVERMSTRVVTDAAIDAHFVDCGIIYDGRNTDEAETLVLSTSTVWTSGTSLTLTWTGPTPGFVAGDVGKSFVLDIDGEKLTCLCTARTSSAIVTVEADRDVPAAFQGVATGVWARAQATITGLSHLESKDVSVLADGFVLSSGDGEYTVASGSITLDRNYSVVHVGLPYVSDLETLDWDSPNGETLLDKQRLVQAVAIMFQESRGGYAGFDEDHLVAMKQRTTEPLGQPVRLQSGIFDVPVPGKWDYRGRIMIRQADPLPMTILSVVPRGKIGG
jgi:hypothetical protein